jgi:hypothetical protein
MFGAKRKKLDAAELEQIGFAFLPIWDPGEHCTICGNYQLPVYAMGEQRALACVYGDIFANTARTSVMNLFFL